MHFVLVNQDTTWAVHRFNCIFFVINDCSIHIFTVMFPVTRCFPQLFIQDDWCADFIIFEIMMYFAPEVFQFVAKSHAFWQEEWEARTFFFDNEQTKFFTKFTVVAFSCFFKQVKVCIKFFFLFKCCTVNTLQHFIFFIAAPVCTCNAL